MSRKGALDVSINSIVVIIFAVTMLSIGVLFIKNYFDKLVVPDVDPSEANPSNPITMGHDSYKASRGSTLELRIKFYNDESNADGTPKALTSIYPTVSCRRLALDATSYFETSSSTANVNFGSKAEFKATVKVSNNAPLGKYPCSINIDTTSYPFFIEVT